MNIEKTPRVLIIDDQKINRLMIILTLKKVGNYHFFEANNGEDGISLAIQQLPHIILIDALMPKLNGFEAIQILRNNSLTQYIPIIMISALSNRNENVQALRFGISDFISKPFEKIELITRVNSLLQLYMMYLENKRDLKNINKELEDKVNLNVQRKIEDIKMASIGKMVTAITHELNTPITYMKLNLELMENDLNDIVGNKNLKKNLFETYEIVNSGLKRLQNIINDTNKISRKGKIGFFDENIYATLIFSTKLIYNRSKYLMPIYLNDVLFDLNLHQNNEDYQFPIIKEKIEQVWIIILNNACDEFERSTKKYNDRKMIIEIIKDHKKLKILFKDNASGGIPEDILPNIFDPFVSNKIDKGTGLGLNIAKDIIEENSGKIKAYNEHEFVVFEVEF